MLDRNKPYGTISGHPVAHFEQDSLLYDAGGNLIGTPKTVKKAVEKEDQILTDNLVSAKNFLRNILREGALTKSVVYRAAQDNNQVWDSVKDAAINLDIKKFTFQKSEMWKLPDDVEA
jgi:hypothetical protein